MTAHGLHVLDFGGVWPTAPVRHVRLWDCGVTWRDIHTGPGSFTWGPLDRAVAACLAHGAQPLYVLGATPQWAARNPATTDAAPWIGPGSNSAPADLGHWDEYVRAVATRYKGHIWAYQAWNEPQARPFWADDFAALAIMTDRAQRIIRDVDPFARMVSAPVLPRPSSGGMVRGCKYLEALRAHGWPVDTFAAHVYPEIGTGPERWTDLVRAWKAGLSHLGAPRRPLWVTETNYNLFGGPLPTRAAASSYVTRTDAAARAEGIARVYWYAWMHADPLLLGVRFNPDSAGTAALTRLLQTR